MKVQVLVRLKSGVLDVQGKAVEQCIHELSAADLTASEPDSSASSTKLVSGQLLATDQVSQVRIGKLIELQVKASSFEQAKTLVDALCDPKTVLRTPDYSKPFILSTDASNTAVGAILYQDFEDGRHPCYYLSRSLTPAEKNYSATEKECLAMVWAMKTLRHYIYGSTFTLVTDHQALIWLMSYKDNSHRLLRWSISLQEFMPFTIQYKLAKTILMLIVYLEILLTW
jgi:phosphoribosylformylglycinamidine (FGAM) synthase PurS component